MRHHRYKAMEIIWNYLTSSSYFFFPLLLILFIFIVALKLNKTVNESYFIALTHRYIPKPSKLYLTMVDILSLHRYIIHIKVKVLDWIDIFIKLYLLFKYTHRAFISTCTLEAWSFCCLCMLHWFGVALKRFHCQVSIFPFFFSCSFFVHFFVLTTVKTSKC